MNHKIETLTQLFPGFEQRVAFLIQNDENFRELYSDYMICISMIHDRKSEVNNVREELAEFEELKREMELEIMKVIMKQTDID